MNRSVTSDAFRFGHPYSDSDTDITSLRAAIPILGMSQRARAVCRRFSTHAGGTFPRRNFSTDESSFEGHSGIIRRRTASREFSIAHLSFDIADVSARKRAAVVYSAFGINYTSYFREMFRVTSYARTRVRDISRGPSVSLSSSAFTIFDC